jgi:acyl carrier protein
MKLPREVNDFLNENVRKAGAHSLQPTDDLFLLGVLDSFALVDFIAVLERSCDIRIPDSDVNPGNFQSVEAIERYLERDKGQSV